MRVPRLSAIIFNFFFKKLAISKTYVLLVTIANNTNHTITHTMKTIEIPLPLSNAAELKKAQSKIKSLVESGYSKRSIGGLIVILTK